MARLTAFFIVVTLINSPVATAVCLTSCHSHVTMNLCTDDMTEPAVASGSESCPSVAESPFLREGGMTFDSVGALAARLTAVPVSRLLLSRVDADRHVLEDRRVQPIPLRL